MRSSKVRSRGVAVKGEGVEAEWVGDVMGDVVGQGVRLVLPSLVSRSSVPVYLSGPDFVYPRVR